MKNPIEIYEKEPQGFAPTVHAAGCYLEIEHKLLLLKKAPGRSAPNTWGVPGGKINQNETPENAAKRELFEETGIRTSQIMLLGTLYVRKPELDYVYHLFKVPIDQLPEVHLSEEHQDYKWATVSDLEEMPLMDGAIESLKYYRAKRSSTNSNF